MDLITTSVMMNDQWVNLRARAWRLVPLSEIQGYYVRELWKAAFIWSKMMKRAITLPIDLWILVDA